MWRNVYVQHLLLSWCSRYATFAHGFACIQDPRRENVFPGELVGYLSNLISNNITPRDIVNRDSIGNALIVAMAVGGSTNVMLHAPEIARAAGYRDFYRDIMSVEEFNHLSTEIVPVIVNANIWGLLDGRYR